jgi:hypothetical protein
MNEYLNISGGIIFGLAVVTLIAFPLFFFLSIAGYFIFKELNENQ